LIAAGGQVNHLFLQGGFPTRSDSFSGCGCATTPRSRGAQVARVAAKHDPRKTQGRRECRVPAAHAASRVKIKNHTSVVTRYAHLTLPRPSHPAPNVRDDAYAPLIEAGRPVSAPLICPTAQAKYFSQEGWTALSQNCPSGKSVAAPPQCGQHCDARNRAAPGMDGRSRGTDLGCGIERPDDVRQDRPDAGI